jgi:hypothetical protein
MDIVRLKIYYYILLIKIIKNLLVNKMDKIIIKVLFNEKINKMFIEKNASF